MSHKLFARRRVSVIFEFFFIHKRVSAMRPEVSCSSRTTATTVEGWHTGTRVKPNPLLAEVGMEGTLIYVRPRTLHNHFESVTHGPRPRSAVKIRKKSEGDGRGSPGRDFRGDFRCVRVGEKKKKKQKSTKKSETSL